MRMVASSLNTRRRHLGGIDMKMLAAIVKPLNSVC